jgi:glucose-6-phosphate 1-dehydrogenase
LPVKLTELRLLFKHPPPARFIQRPQRRPQPSQIVFKIDPSTGIRIILDAHRADMPGPSEVTFDLEFAQEGGEDPTPYEVLLHAAIVGDATHFTRQDNVEECWRIVQPLLDSPPPVHSYARGSWGPDEAASVAGGFGGWRDPWLPATQQAAS